MSLLDSAVKLYHKREKEQNDLFFGAFEHLNNPGDSYRFENTNVNKIWFWACKRWGKSFTTREFELRG